MDEGYIKFDLHWEKGPPPASRRLPDLIALRDQLHRQRAIGAYPGGIGFGNVSIRDAQGIIISGTQTGGIPETTPAHYTRLTGWDVSVNRVDCLGPVKASSESLTHAMIYDMLPRIGAVIHVHLHDLWEHVLDRGPATHPEVAYGTPAMAEEVERLLRTEDLGRTCIFAMAGHEDGLVVFGPDPGQAMARLNRARAGIC